jgi:hypothetical protein
MSRLPGRLPGVPIMLSAQPLRRILLLRMQSWSWTVFAGGLSLRKLLLIRIDLLLHHVLANCERSA